MSHKLPLSLLQHRYSFQDSPCPCKIYISLLYLFQSTIHSQNLPIYISYLGTTNSEEKDVLRSVIVAVANVIYVNDKLKARQPEEQAQEPEA